LTLARTLVNAAVPEQFCAPVQTTGSISQFGGRIDRRSRALWRRL